MKCNDKTCAQLIYCQLHSKQTRISHNYSYKLFSYISATREKISSAACPTPGCKGIGHVKGAKYSTHHSTFGCPYSLQNLNKDSCLVDRLSNNSMTEESDWSYASKQKLAVVKAIKGKELLKLLFNDNCRNCRGLIGRFSLSISGQTHEFIIYAMRQRATADKWVS